MATQGWESNRPAVEALLLRAVDMGLTAAAALYASEITNRLRNGFTSGDFVTGNLADSVTFGRPEWRDGKRCISIGTNFEYALFWELGHLSLWTADYEHVPVWVPTLNELAPQLRALFLEEFQKVWKPGGAR